MSIGTGIFISALFLGCVLLYIKSENKAKWRKFLGYLIGIPLVVLLGVLIYQVIEWQFEKRSYQTEAPKETSIKGINLGDSLSDLQFRYGRFTKEKIRNRGYDLYKVSSVLTIWTRDSKVEMITYGCEDPPDYTVLGPVQCGDNGEKIIKEYGERNVEIKCFDNDDLRRFYGVEKKKLAFVLERNRVIWLQVNNVQIEKPIGLKDCS
jgi:hypothetical protein